LSSEFFSNDQLDITKIPRHVAIIMDGNGRWAKKRFMNRVKGHEKGAETVRTIARACREINIPILTLYAFSTENWHRPKNEVMALMRLLKNFLISEELEFMRNNVQLGVIGQVGRLPDDVHNALSQMIAKTAANNGLLLNLALSYGGRAEITDMVRAIAAKAVKGVLTAEDIDENLVGEHLYTSNIPDPDILIRTGGEMRISNFLLWQLAYSEIFITPSLWPEFSREEFIQIIYQYQQRDRRFGKVKE
jgi:undecaprenyl diphosphate synthase